MKLVEMKTADIITEEEYEMVQDMIKKTATETPLTFDLIESAYTHTVWSLTNGYPIDMGMIQLMILGFVSKETLEKLITIKTRINPTPAAFSFY